jgi:predicted secreted protein
MASNAFSGVGTVFGRGNGSSGTETFTPLAEVNSITGPNKTRDTIDVTSLDSEGGYREFIAGFRDGGEVSLEMNFTYATYDIINDDFESEDSVNYQIELPDGTSFTFTGLVTAVGLAVPLDDKVTSSVTVKISGQVVIGTPS